MNLQDLPAAALAFVQAVRGTAVDPADQVRLMLAQAAAAPLTPVGAVLRRMALTELARASSDYQPVSHEDAKALQQVVCAALDAEIDRAGNDGEDEVYMAFRMLRIAVVLDLRNRGDQLPNLRQVTVPPLPPEVLAYRLYGDATRADDLVARADPANPVFMPTNLTVLDR